MRALLFGSAVLEAVGLAGTFLAPYDSVQFALTQRAIEGGLLGILLCVFLWRRRSVEAAYEVGIEVGVRRGRKAARGLSVVHLPDDGVKARQVAGRHHSA